MEPTVSLTAAQFAVWQCVASLIRSIISDTQEDYKSHQVGIKYRIKVPLSPVLNVHHHKTENSGTIKSIVIFVLLQIALNRVPIKCPSSLNPKF